MIPTNVGTGSGMRCPDPENIGIGSAKRLWPTRPGRLPTLAFPSLAIRILAVQILPCTTLRPWIASKAFKILISALAVRLDDETDYRKTLLVRTPHVDVLTLTSR